MCVREGVRDRTELQHIDPHSYGHQRWVCLVLQSCSTGGPGAHSAGCGLSLPHLVSNFSVLHLTDFLSSPSYIIVQSPTQSLEWHVWSSSRGNNCHAVHRSLSSGASVYECTMGFYLVPYFQPSPPTRFLLITAIGMCHFLPVHHFGMACLAGSKVNIQHFVSGLVYCAANWSELRTVYEESSTMTQFTPPEIWKRHAVLLDIQTGSSHVNLSEHLAFKLRTD